MTKPAIAIVKCRDLPEPDPDHEPLVCRLSELGAKVQTISWDADPPDSFEVDACVLRATWNYYHFPERFLTWCREVAARTRLLNPAPIVAWNCDKHYLADLARVGVEVVPTKFLERGSDPQSLRTLLEQQRWSNVVLKPTISAASFATRAFAVDKRDAAAAFLAKHLPQRAMMIQPFVTSTRTIGEKSIAWIDDAITHAWIKHPRFAGEHERVEPTDQLSDADRALVAQAMAGIPYQGTFYARIDVMYGEDGRPLLSELELIEPSLHFRFSPGALERFAKGLLRTGEVD